MQKMLRSRFSSHDVQFRCVLFLSDLDDGFAKRKRKYIIKISIFGYDNIITKKHQLRHQQKKQQQ